MNHSDASSCPELPRLPRLRRQAAKFAIAVAVWLVSSFLMVKFQVLELPMFIVAGLSFACAILCFFDLAKSLRAACTGQRFLTLVFGILQFLRGLFFLVTGLAFFAGYQGYLYFIAAPAEYMRFLLLLGVVLVWLALFRASYTKSMGILAWIVFWAFGGLGLLAALSGYTRMKTAFRPYSPEDEAFWIDRL
jgi:hypothetical protein